MAVLVLDEFEGPSVGTQCVDGLGAVGQNQGVVEHGRRRLQADVDLDGIAVRWLHRTERRRHEARDRSFVRQPIGEGHERLAVTSVRNEDSATRRVRMLPSPVRANNDSAGDTETSGVTSRVKTFGIGAGMLRNAEPRRHAFGELRRDIHQAGRHPLPNRRRLHARELENGRH